MDIKDDILKIVEEHRPRLIDLARKIHEHPELGFQEYKASDWLTDYLSEQGFKIKKGLCALETAFDARYGVDEPVIAFMAEYDALPEIGHACGHNLIAASSVGAGLATKAAVDRFGGTICVIGTPAEELGGGKARLIEGSAFEGIDAALMIHPQKNDIAVMESSALATVSVEFHGREAHAGVQPSAGINALEALIQSFNLLNSLRQRLEHQGQINGIITHGGKAANVIPSYSRGEFVVRAPTDRRLEENKKLIEQCFRAASLGSGARLEISWGVHLRPMRTNLTIANLFAANMRLLGRTMRITPPHQSFGSTDIGNVSQILPTMQALLAVAPSDVQPHTPKMAAICDSQAGFQGMLDGAKGLALTACDLLTDRDLLKAAQKEFNEWSA